MNSISGKTYHITTFGCQMNEHDSEVMAGLLREAGCRPEESREDADIVIINTCSVRENADKRFFGTLGQLKKQKALHPGFIACVCGCMLQQEHVIIAVRQKYPWVDVVFGTHNIHELPALLEELLRKREERQTGNEDLIPGDEREYALAKHAIRSAKDTRVIRVKEDMEEIVEGLPAERLFPHKAFVNIMFGCNNFCTYCIVPYTRGREKSRRPEEILREVRGLVADGVKEVTLLGQNVNSYRGRGEDREWDFTDLIYALNDVEGLARIRFMTSHPKDLSDRLIEAFRRCEKLCPYIHLPVQAGSSRILKKMNRRYTAQDYLRLVRKLRQAVPDLAVSTDIIVGFPGETEEDFQETLDLVREVGYDSAFTFLYSRRQGTPAAEDPDQVTEEVKHRRFDRLVEVMNGISAEKNEALVGSRQRVLVDGISKKKPGILSGRTPGFKLVDFPGNADLIGQFADVVITGARTFSLTGELVNEKGDLTGGKSL